MSEIMQHLKIYNKQDILSVTKIRQFETKLGERVLVAANAAALAESIEKTPAEYILLGIPEDIGIKANGGEGGATTAWLPFLKDLVAGQKVLSGRDVRLRPRAT